VWFFGIPAPFINGEGTELMLWGLHTCISWQYRKIFWQLLLKHEEYTESLDNYLNTQLIVSPGRYERPLRTTTINGFLNSAADESDVTLPGSGIGLWRRLTRSLKTATKQLNTNHHNDQVLQTWRCQSPFRYMQDSYFRILSHTTRHSFD